MVSPKVLATWNALTGVRKRESGGVLQIGRYRIETDSVDWFDYPLSRPPRIASTEPNTGEVPTENRYVTVQAAVLDSALAQAKPVKKRASKRKKSKV